MAYAYGATITHTYEGTTVSIRIVFAKPMNQNVKPADELWLVELDDIETEITDSFWLDEYSLQLDIEDIDNRPATVIVSYLGPSPLLVTTWGKQWQPWSSINSIDESATIFQTGMIILWSGAEEDIPNGWQLCDGSGSSPDLRDSFIIGAGNTYNVDDTGGTIQHLHTATQATHSHVLIGGAGVQSGEGISSFTSVKTPTITVQKTNHLPPYYALCYIMKL